MNRVLWWDLEWSGGYFRDQGFRRGLADATRRGLERVLLLYVALQLPDHIFRDMFKKLVKCDGRGRHPEKTKVCLQCLV